LYVAVVAVGFRDPQGAVLEVLRPIDTTVVSHKRLHLRVPLTLGAPEVSHGFFFAVVFVHSEVVDVHYVARGVRVLVQVDTRFKEILQPFRGGLVDSRRDKLESCLFRDRDKELRPELCCLICLHVVAGCILVVGLVEAKQIDRLVKGFRALDRFHDLINSAERLVLSSHIAFATVWKSDNNLCNHGHELHSTLFGPIIRVAGMRCGLELVVIGPVGKVREGLIGLRLASVAAETMLGGEGAVLGDVAL